MTITLRRCLDCAAWHHYPRARCPRCLSDRVADAHSPGEGSVYACAALTTDPAAPTRVVAIIELDEGARVTGNLEGAAGWTVGDRVRVCDGAEQHPWRFERARRGDA